MLVLTRKEDETIVVGHGLVTVKVKRITRRTVVICIDAPKELSIHRGEVELRTKEDKDAA